eukprot:g2067.t1
MSGMSRFGAGAGSRCLPARRKLRWRPSLAIWSNHFCVVLQLVLTAACTVPEQAINRRFLETLPRTGANFQRGEAL